MPLRSLIRSENDFIDVSVDLRLPLNFAVAFLVVSVTSNDKLVYWYSTPVTDYITPGLKGRVFCSFRLSDIEMRHHGLMLRTFLWNPSKSRYIMDDFTVRVRSGNPVIYGIFKKVDL